jgi:ABC-type phosphate/phosphonate transport system substrate-binding protein
VGYLSDRVEYSVQYMASAIDFFRRRLAGAGVRDVNLKVAASIEEMGEWLKTGRVHVFASTPYPVLQTCRIAGVEPVLEGIGTIPRLSRFYVRADSSVAAMDQLEGKRIAFTFPYSSPGYFIPLRRLRELGYCLDRPEPGRRVVYSSFSGHSVNSLYWLFFGKCDLAAVAADDLDEKKLARRLLAAVRPLGEGEAYPAFLVLLAPGLDSATRSLLIGFLRRVGDDPEGRRMLEQNYRCSSLQPVGARTADWLRRATGSLPELVAPGRAPKAPAGPPAAADGSAGATGAGPAASGTEAMTPARPRIENRK